MPYVGYTPEGLLPFQRGQRVRVVKGAVVKSTHPDAKRKARVAPCAQWVKVDFVHTGKSLLLWRSYPDTSETTLQMRPHELEALCSQYSTDVDGLKARCVVERRAAHTDWYFPVENPAIQWTSKAGHTCEVDVNEVG